MNAVPYVDGWFGGNREITVEPSPEFPFRNAPSPDTFSRLYHRRFQTPARTWVSRMGVRTAWTNSVLFSETLGGAAWVPVNASINTNAATAPNGEATMDAVLETTATGEHSLAQAVTVTAVETEVSIFGKAGLTREWIRLAFVDSAAVTHYAFFNLNGTIGNRSSAVAPSIVALGDGFFRFVLKVTPAAGAGTFKVNTSTNGTLVSFAGSTTAGAYLWGAQVTAGTVTPYISTAASARSISAPDRDPMDPFAYLIEEDNPDVTNSERVVVNRVFSRIPRQQTDPGSRFVTKPDLPGEFPQQSGNSIIIQPEEGVPRWIFYSNKPVVSDSGIPTGNNPTGGTFTITIGSNTTTGLAFNASAATVAAALNSLASVTNRGSVTVTGSYTAGFVITFAQYPAATINTSALTYSGLAGTSVASTAYNITDLRITMSATSSFAGGTFTITVFGQTTSPIAYNANVTAVKTALEALTNVGAGKVTVSTPSAGYVGGVILRNTGTEISFYMIFLLPAASASGASLTPVGSAATASTGTDKTVRVTLTGVNLGQRILNSPGHGFGVLDGIVVTQGANYRTIAPGLYSVDTDTVILTLASGDAFTDPTPITAVGASTGNVYTAGSKLTRTKRITDFYLLGVSFGVDTLDDIPLPEYEGDSASMLAAIFNGDEDINYEVGELEVYRSGPMVQRTRTTINASTL